MVVIFTLTTIPEPNSLVIPPISLGRYEKNIHETFEMLALFLSESMRDALIQVGEVGGAVGGETRRHHGLGEVALVEQENGQQLAVMEYIHLEQAL